MEIVEVAKDSALVEMNKGASQPVRRTVRVSKIPQLLGLLLLRILPLSSRCEPPGHARGRPPAGSLPLP